MARPVGSKNGVTQDMRNTVRMLVTKKLPEMEKWIDKIEDPKEKLKGIVSLMDYCMPKLQRTELVGDPDKPLQFSSFTKEQAQELLELYVSKHNTGATRGGSKNPSK